jgi:serine protease Do
MQAVCTLLTAMIPVFPMLRVWVALVIGMSFPRPAAAEPDDAVSARVTNSVVKVRVVDETHRIANGSAVAVGSGTFITSCHGTRKARRIDVLSRGEHWPVKRVVNDIEHDLCLLQIDAGGFDSFEFADGNTEPRVGDSVTAVGFAGPEVRISQGTVKALHRYDGAKVIQTDATFRGGESGGALIDRHGKLVGVLTFFAGAARDYFAVPARWARALAQRVEADRPIESQPELAFWERPDPQRPTFLRAVAREYVQDWEGLRDISVRWVQQEAENPEAWIALGKAYYRCAQDTFAVAALKEAIRLEPHHPEAWYHLGAAHLAMNDSEAAQAAVERLQALSPKAANALRALMTPGR